MEDKKSNFKYSVMETLGALRAQGYRKFVNLGKQGIKAIKDNPNEFKIVDIYEKEKQIFLTKAEIVRDAIKLKLQMINDGNKKTFGRMNQSKEGLKISIKDVERAERYMETLRDLKKEAINRDMQLGFFEDGPMLDAIEDVMIEAERLYDIFLCSGYMLESDPKSEKKYRYKTSKDNRKNAIKTRAKTMEDIDVR